MGMRESVDRYLSVVLPARDRTGRRGKRRRQPVTSFSPAYEALEPRVAMSATPLVTAPVMVNAATDFHYQPWNGSIAIQSYTGTKAAVVIPETIDGLPVTVLQSDAFFDRQDVTSVVLPDSLTTIYGTAFNGAGITTITLPQNVTFAYNAFKGANALTTIDVDPRNPVFRSIDGVLFCETGETLEEYPPGRQGGYVIPDGVTGVRKEAFASCSKLTAVTLPSSLRFVGESAFASCSSLQRVVIQNGLEVIPQFAFLSCHTLTNVTIPSSVQSMTYAFVDCPGLIRIDGTATAITELRVAKRAGGRIRLTWKAPQDAAWGTDNQSLVLRRYRVEVSGNGGRTWNATRHADPTLTTAVVNGLKPGKSYLFRVTPRIGFNYAAPFANDTIVSGQSATISTRARGSSPLVVNVPAPPGWAS